jgi:hypothetical protein
MQYASTKYINNLETIVALLPLKQVPRFDPSNPPPRAYAVPDNVRRGWVKRWTTEPTRDADTGEMLDAGAYEFQPPSGPTFAQIQTRYVAAVQKRLDDFARTRGYDGIMAACTYALSQDPQWQLEGQCCLLARDNTWDTCYQVINAAEGNTEQLPAFDEFMALLPVLRWPGEVSE